MSLDRLKDLVHINSKRDITNTMELETLVDVIEKRKENQAISHILPFLYVFSFSFSFSASAIVF